MSYERDQDPMDRPPLPPAPDEFRRGRRGRGGGGRGGGGDSGKPRSRALPIFIALFALGAFAGIVWYAYTQGVQSGASTVVPVIKAEEGPTKAKPEQPGGLQVPHQDKQVFQRLLPEGQTPQTVERLLPPPPEPLQPPPAPAPAAPAATPSAIAPAQPLPSQSVAERPVATPQPAPQATPQAAPQAAPQGVPPVPSAAPMPQPPQDTPARTQPAAESPAPQPTAEPKAEPAQPQPQDNIAAVSGGGFKVQLAAVRSEEAAKQEWNRLKNRYKEELRALTLTVQRVDLGAGKGVYYRIQAGPLNEAAAERTCAALKAKNHACLVVRP